MPTLAVNLSLKQLQTGERSVELILQILTKWGLAPEDLELDVSEAMLAHVTLHKSNVLDRLQQLGVKIAIDDFGTQYSSLDYLKTYRVSRVKIPASLVDASTHDSEASAMVRAIVGIGREFGNRCYRQGRGDGGAAGVAELRAVACEGARLLLQRAGSGGPGDGALAPRDRRTAPQLIRPWTEAAGRGQRARMPDPFRKGHVG